MTNTVELLIVLDRSGSMASARSDHEGGLRTFLEEQAKEPGDVRVTFVQFDSANACEVIEDRTPVADVKPPVLVPRGGTPLLDAVGKSIAHLEDRLKASGDTPSQVICLIITDGFENDSHEWNREQLKTRIAELDAREWSFLYLGASQDAWHDASSIGTRGSTFVAYNQSAPMAAYGAVSSNMTRSRSLHQSTFTAAAAMGGTTQDWQEQALNISKAALNFNDAQRDAAASGGTYGDVAGTFADQSQLLGQLNTGQSAGTVQPTATPVTDDDKADGGI